MFQGELEERRQSLGQGERLGEEWGGGRGQSSEQWAWHPDKERLKEQMQYGGTQQQEEISSQGQKDRRRG